MNFFRIKQHLDYDQLLEMLESGGTNTILAMGIIDNFSDRNMQKFFKYLKFKGYENNTEERMKLKYYVDDKNAKEWQYVKYNNNDREYCFYYNRLSKRIIKDSFRRI